MTSARVDHKSAQPDQLHNLRGLRATLLADLEPEIALTLYERVRSRRGTQIALVASARKLSVLFWHLLTREEDYAFQRPTLTRRKLRGLELKVKDGRRSWPSGHAVGTREEREREREFAEQVETAYRRLVEDWQPKARRSGAGATRGHASSSHLLDEETAARQG
jgi:hypothetical protein